MNARPLVSIAIPAYNHASFIEACLKSVCSQSYSELELVLIDDGSKDLTFEIATGFLETYGSRFRRIVLEKRQNQGVSANSNACIEACRGKWVHLLGSDDVAHPNKVERTQSFIEKWGCQNLALVHADCDYIDEHGNPAIRKNQKTRPLPGPDFQAYRWLFLGKHYVFNPTIALNRDIFLSNGGFDKTLPLEDLDCWLRLSVNHAIGLIPETLASYRKHPGNSSRRRIKMLAAQFNTYAKFLETHPSLFSSNEIREHFRDNVWRFWRRVRRKRPDLLLTATQALLVSHLKTPRSADYARFGYLLDEMTP